MHFFYANDYDHYQYPIFSECPPIPALAHVFPYLNIADMMQIHKLLKAAEQRESQAERNMDNGAQANE